MPKRPHIALVILPGILLSLMAWQMSQAWVQKEPVYRGERLSVWLNAYRKYGLAGVETWQVRLEQQDADEAVRRIGTNALPTLLRMLRAQDSALKVKFMDLAAKQHLIQIRYTAAEEQHYQACCAFGMLRAKARSAVPALIQIAHQNPSHDSRCYALAALASIGPPAKEAMPFLLECVTNADGMVGVYADNALKAIDPEAAAKAGVK